MWSWSGERATGWRGFFSWCSVSLYICVTIQDKITEFFYMADGFCDFFDAMMKNTGSKTETGKLSPCAKECACDKNKGVYLVLSQN
jgi:hypothetical protein